MLHDDYDRDLRAFVLNETQKRLAHQNQTVSDEAEDALAAYGRGELEDTPAVLCELATIHNELSALELRGSDTHLSKGKGGYSALRKFLTDPLAITVAEGVS